MSEDRRIPRDKNPQKVMSFVQHLEELRQRLKYCLIAIGAGVILAYVFSEFLFILLSQPLIEAWRSSGLGIPKIHFANPIEPFFTYLKIALIGGIFFAAPVVFYQIWRFIAPGLYRHEKRFAVPFAIASSLFFAGGACFGYFVVFPYGFRFFLSYANKNMGSMYELLGGTAKISVKETFELQPTLMMGEYFALVWRLLL
ncbi:MAG: twin-arginine translocase subunit TatC, partial [Pseudomonadota bacterium]